MNSFSKQLARMQDDPRYIVLLALALLVVALIVTNRKQFLFILKSLSRNLARTILTSLAVLVLVFVVMLIWTVLWFLDLVTSEKARDLKAIVTEKWQIPSQMPYAYAASLSEGAAKRPEDVKPDDAMTWQFYGGTLDP